MKHPAVVQIRDPKPEHIDLIFKILKRFEFEVERVRNGIDIYFEDVNDARIFISKIKRLIKFDLKFSTKYAGLRRGRVRILFVYCLRPS